MMDSAQAHTCWCSGGQREAGFVLARRHDEVDVVECTRDPAAFDRTVLKLFRSYYLRGRNFLVTPSGAPAYSKRYGEV
jgi:hypothetical protein